MFNLGVVIEELGEKLVALTPTNVSSLSKFINVRIEKNAGLESGFKDEDYVKAGASIIQNRQELIELSDIIVTVNSTISIDGAQDPKIVISAAAFQYNYELLMNYTNRPVTLFSLSNLTETVLAKSMNANHSIRRILGYQAVITGLNELPKVAPLTSTDGGTLPPSKILILGADQEGMQAIITAKRMGAVVSVFDTNNNVKEKVHRAGANYIEIDGAIDILNLVERNPSHEVLAIHKIQKTIESLISAFDIIITSIKYPFGSAPILITSEMMRKMSFQSVLIDLVSEIGGNCEKPPNEQIKMILGSKLYNKKANSCAVLIGQNFENFITHLLQMSTTLEADDILHQACVIENGVLKHKELIHQINTYN